MEPGIKKTYTIQEARLTLGIDSKTLSDWMEKAGIEPVAHRTDRRSKTLSTTQIAQLAQEHQRALSPEAIQRSPLLQAIVRRLAVVEDFYDMKRVEGKLADQEKRIDELEAKLKEIAERPVVPLSSYRDLRAARREVDREATRTLLGDAAPRRQRTESSDINDIQLDDEHVAWRAYTRWHGISESTVKDAVENKRLPIVQGTWHVTGHALRQALGPEGQQLFHQFWGYKIKKPVCPLCPGWVEDSVTVE
jgi:hypothetical protein